MAVIKPVITGSVKRRRIRIPGKGFRGEVIGFCRILRRSGMKITSGHIIDLFRSLDNLDITNIEDIYIASKTNLVASQEESAIFEAVFRQYWFDEKGSSSTDAESAEVDSQFVDEGEGDSGEGSSQGEEGDTEAEGQSNENPGLPQEEDSEEGGEPGEAGEEEDGIASYSPSETLSDKDFSSLEVDQIAQLRRLIAQLIPKLATKISRRRKPDMRSSEVDMRRSVKKSVRTGGEVLQLYRKKRKIQKTQIILICDVSGSMDSYSQFLIQFLYSLQSEIKSLRTFVFSTRLSDATPYLRHKDVNQALKRLSLEVHDWSGGTQIGNCLKTFNFDYGRTILNSRTIAIIISDGWDRGDTDLLSEEMERLRKKCHKLIWLNPLLGSPGYRPIDRGMRTALPYCDEFMSAHNLDSLIVMTNKIAQI